MIIISQRYLWLYQYCDIVFNKYYRCMINRGLESDPSKLHPSQEHFTTFLNFHWIRIYFLF